ncbi:MULTISPECIES: AzlC family ABC transporter permease [Vibrio]|uniref:Branched-chain amino acid ABC transporter permease n=1 Tax=Vibrio algicola TaxID=2662262 RepID=A0A5Q0TIK1_9VIBR|nr:MULTISPECIES: AzlC family ABC transporter permease [Vibrio]MBD1576492.1 AzlC family ABC transporter permease [Vibrio sp. S11_S32]
MKKQLIQAGLKSIFPLCVGAFPFSFIVGAVSINAGMTVFQSTMWSMTVFAGSAQMVALGLVQSSSEMLVIMLTTFVINLRHVLYSASLSDHVKEYSLPMRMFMAYGLTDEVYASSIQEMKEEKPNRHWYYLAVMLGFWINWVVADFLGAMVGSSFPQIASYGLDFAMVAAFIAIVIPQVKNRECIVAAVVATVTGILLSGLPYSLGLVVAAVVGVYAGYRMDLSTEAMQEEAKAQAKLELQQEALERNTVESEDATCFTKTVTE